MSQARPQIEPEVAVFIREALARTTLDSSRLDAPQRDLQAFYRSNGYLPVWVDGRGHPNDAAATALGLLRTVSDEGLDPLDYESPALDRQRSLLLAESRSAPEIAVFDLQLTLNILRYLRQLHLGRVDPRSIGFQIVAPAEQHDFSGVLHAALSGHQLQETLTALAPALAEYRSLRTTLMKYRSLAANASLASVHLPAAVLRPGQQQSDLPALQQWLAALGDMPSSTPAPNAVYEGSLVDGVKRFQSRHGLAADGVIGKETLQALHVPLSWRVRQIELALERLRWLPDPTDERFLAVDIPMFHLWAWDSARADGLFSFETDVIVGRALSHKTPVFVAEMRSIEFRPSWNVPASIVRNEILPALARDPAYLQREDMELTERNGQVTVRQRPGPNNALGLIKFIFPNVHDVYMHATPAQALFSRARRDFSHGCIRLEDPVGLAEWALKEQPEWTRARIVSTMEGRNTLRVELARPIRVILFYVTAAVMPEDGTIHFVQDVYGHDSTLDAALKRTHAGAE